MRNFFINLFMVFISLFVGLAFFELILYINNYSSYEKTYSDIVLNNTKYRLIEQESAFAGTEKALLFVGDSFTEGKSCGNDNNFPGYFQQILDAQNINLQKINLGVGGAQTFSYLTILNEYLKTYKPPKGVIITLYINDVELEPSMCPLVNEIKNSTMFQPSEIDDIISYCSKIAQTNHRNYGPEFSPYIIAHRWLAQKFLTYRLLREHAGRLSLKLGYNMGAGRTAYPNYWLEQDKLRFKLVNFALNEIKRTVEQYNSEMFVVFYPDVTQLSSDGPFADIYDQSSKKLSSILNVPVLSGYEAFLSRPNTPTAMVWSWTDSHPNCEAHQIFAQWLFDNVNKHTNWLNQ